MGAVHFLAYLELFGYAACHFLQGEADFKSEVAASIALLSSAAAESSETTKTTKAGVSAEDVAEHAENVIHVHACTAAESACTAQAFVSELIVSLALLRVVQYVISLGCLLELFFSLFVTGVSVGVVFDGHFLVGLLYLLLRCSLADAEHFVIISFLCHGECFFLESYYNL